MTGDPHTPWSISALPNGPSHGWAAGSQYLLQKQSTCCFYFYLISHEIYNSICFKLGYHFTSLCLISSFIWEFPSLGTWWNFVSIPSWQAVSMVSPWQQPICPERLYCCQGEEQNANNDQKGYAEMWNSSRKVGWTVVHKTKWVHLRIYGT